MKGVVEVYVNQGAEDVALDYCGKGSVIGQYSLLGGEQCLFGLRAVTSCNTTILKINKEAFTKMRMRHISVD